MSSHQLLFFTIQISSFQIAPIYAPSHTKRARILATRGGHTFEYKKGNILNSFTGIGIMFKRAKQRFLAKRRNLFVLTSAFVLHHPIDVISYLSLPGDVRFGKSRSITSQFHSRSFANCQIAAWVQGRNHRWNWKEKKIKFTSCPIELVPRSWPPL